MEGNRVESREKREERRGIDPGSTDLTSWSNKWTASQGFKSTGDIGADTDNGTHTGAEVWRAVLLLGVELEFILVIEVVFEAVFEAVFEVVLEVEIEVEFVLPNVRM